MSETGATIPRLPRPRLQWKAACGPRCFLTHACFSTPAVVFQMRLRTDIVRVLIDVIDEFPVRSDHVPKPPGFILPCQPALADRPPSGPGWLHEIKFDGYRVIARKDGEQVRLWARTTSDYSKAFTRIRDAVAALPVRSAVLDGEAVVFRSDSSSDFEALKSRHGQAEAILVAYDIMEVDGQDVRPEPLESAGSG